VRGHRHQFKQQHVHQLLLPYDDSFHLVVLACCCPWQATAVDVSLLLSVVACCCWWQAAVVGDVGWLLLLVHLLLLV
jgi:hypothetical protein